jgi:hypothetical protein
MSDECNIINADVDLSKREGGDPNRVTTRKKVQRRPGKSRNARLYFHAGTQQAIVDYQQALDKKTREALYVHDIKPAFEKLVENLMNIHKFSIYYDSHDDMISDCVNFLFETIHKFDASRGTNAFSYFNVVAKNWLIIKSKQKLVRARRNVSIHDPEGLTSAEMRTIDEHCVIPSQDEIIEQTKTFENILVTLYDVRSQVKTENELSCINSIITIFENIDDLDIINKGAILLYMRELSGLQPKQLTLTMQSIRKYYKEVKKSAKVDECPIWGDDEDDDDSEEGFPF